MMHKVSQSIFAAAALAVVLAGCQNGDAPTTTSSSTPPQPVTNATPIPQMPSGDPSLPDATTAFAAPDAGEKSMPMHDAIAAQQKSSPQKALTKADESKSMPQPGQANDHSTTALDKKKGG